MTITPEEEEKLIAAHYDAAFNHVKTKHGERVKDLLIEEIQKSGGYNAQVLTNAARTMSPVAIADELFNTHIMNNTRGMNNPPGAVGPDGKPLGDFDSEWFTIRAAQKAERRKQKGR